MSMPPPPARTAPPPVRRSAPPPAGGSPETAARPAADRFQVRSGRVAMPQKVVLYGPGGIGKSSLARLAPKPVVLDVEGSTNRLDVDRIPDLASWDDLRECLRSPVLDAYETVIIDSVTKAEEMAVAWTLANVRTEKGATPTSVEGYGFGKGYQHVFDTFLHLLVECDRHVRAGRNVVFIAHVCTARVPNPMGEDFIRYEPRLQQTKEGKASIRNRVVEWADHVLFLGYDVASEDGKGTGAGTRSIFTKEQPTHIAKVREAADAKIEDRYDYTSSEDGAIWPVILSAKGGAA